jgi:predicted porin
MVDVVLTQQGVRKIARFALFRLMALSALPQNRVSFPTKSVALTGGVLPQVITLRVPALAQSTRRNTLMKKTLLAAAVMGAFAVPAAAQTSNVTLYGRANLGVDSYVASGATDPDGAGPLGSSDASFKRRTRIFDSGSRLGVRGVEDLGNGLRAIFQIESGANIDNGAQPGQGGQANLNAGYLASRDSFVGLEGGFGRVTVGRQSIWWVNGTIIQTGANYVNAEVPWLNMASMGRLGVGVARASNVLMYTTPTFAGFNGTIYYSPDASGTGTPSVAAQACAPGANVFANSECAQANVRTDARIIGGTARWAGGPFSAQADIVQRRATSGFTPAGLTATHQPENTAWKVLGGWRYMPGAQISAIYGRLKSEDNTFGAAATNATVQQDLKQSMWGVSWEHTFGNIQALAQYSQLGKVTGCVAGVSCDDTKARGYMVGARYLMSKRTALYATYNQVTNQANQRADYTGGAVTSANPLTNGADPKIWALGVIHNF